MNHFVAQEYGKWAWFHGLKITINKNDLRVFRGNYGLSLSPFSGSNKKGR